MTTLSSFDEHFNQCPLIAILRGIRPQEAEAIGEALVANGITIIEVPLNSTDALTSIERMAQRLGSDAIVGAGTVLTVAAVERVLEVGGRFMVSPNVRPDVIEATVAAGLVSLPGFATPSEAFAALSAGAHALKLFPAESSSPAALKAMLAVLGPNVRVLPVGGITAAVMPRWRDAGAAGFGLGSAIYIAGLCASEVGQRTREFVTTVLAAKS